MDVASRTFRVFFVMHGSSGLVPVHLRPCLGRGREDDRIAVPLYRYYCATNDQTIDVHHRMKEVIARWGELCAAAGLDPGDTDIDAPVERHLFPTAVHTPTGNSQLKSQGFAKLVRRDNGVYENVTALEGEKRYVTADDASSMPDLKRRKLD